MVSDTSVGDVLPDEFEKDSPLEALLELETAQQPSDLDQATPVLSEEDRVKNAITSHKFFILGKNVYGNALMCIAAKDGKLRIILGYNLLANAEALQIKEKEEELTGRVRSALKDIQEYLQKSNKKPIRTPYDRDKVWFSFDYVVEYARDDSLKKSISRRIKEARSINKHIKNKILPNYFKPPTSFINRVSLIAKRALSYVKLSSYPELFTNLSGPDVYQMQKTFYRQRHRPKVAK